MSNVKGPNFFIVGAPKSGTTSLFEYLSTHPNVFTPKMKEPHFFSDDLAAGREIHTLKEYLLLFEKIVEGETAIGEASTGYLYSSVAAENIKKFNPEAKIIAILRNPVDMIYSLHSQFYYAFIECEKNFIKAWRLQDKRLSGYAIPRNCKVPEVLQYRKMAKYDEQIKRLFNTFPKEQIKIIISQNNKKRNYLLVCDF